VLKGSYVMFPAASAPPMLFTLVLLNGLSAVSLNMFLPSLSNIAADFQAGYGLLASASIAGYAGMTTVLQLLIGPLSDRVGRRPVILVSLVIFVLASLGCLLARDVWTFLLFRTMQAAIVSGFVLSRVIIRDTEPAQKAASLMGYLSIAWAIVPMLSPMLGGAFDQLFGWRANFWAFLGFGAGVLALCWIDLGETNKIPSDTFTKQFKAFPSLFRSRRFWGYSLCMAFSMGALYAFLAAAPLVATAVFQMSPATLGFYMGSTAAGFILGSFVSGQFAARYRLPTMMVAGRMVAFVGLTVGLGLLLAGIVHEVSLFGSCVFLGFGNGVSMPSSNAGAMSVRPELIGSAAGLSGALTGAGGALTAGITGIILHEANAAFVLLGMMLLSSTMALLAALFVLWLDRRESEGNPA
jgi:DHA1 family bicyclomycin/chloramphenicol resistance-like MFS transporter